MRRVIVSVGCPEAGIGRDLEIPVDVPARALAELLARSFGLASGAGARVSGYVMEAYPPGRVLRPDETLASAGVWDGSWLFLRARLE